MIRSVLIGLLSLFITTVQAQEQLSARAQADRLFDRYEYFKSLNIYLKLADADNPDKIVVERVADCYRLMNNYNQAEQWYARAVNYKGMRPADTYFYAEALLRNRKFDKAKEQYKLYFAKVDNAAVLNFKLATCDSAIAWMKKPGSYKVGTEKNINSADADWGVNYSGKTGLIFTSDRSTGDAPGSRGIYNRTGNEWLKLFNYDLKSGSTTEMQLDNTGEINLTKDYHTGPIAINATGDTAYITVTTRLSKGQLPNDRATGDQHIFTRRLELMMATRVNGKWGNFTRFPYDNAASYSVGHAALSKSGNQIYFTSDMRGGYGKTDIWYCQKTTDGKWGKPVNCGNTINTADDEAFPFIGGDDKLYYSSKGLPGMGGYDIFMAKGSGVNWGTPVNLKYPINSTSDDFCMVTNDGITGYLSSDREGGKGNDDIYNFTNLSIDKNKTDTIKKATDVLAVTPTAVTPIPGSAGMVTLQGLVLDMKTNDPLDSVTVILKNTKGEKINTGISRSSTGFSFRVNSNQDYILEARKKGFYPVSQQITAGNISTVILTPLKLTLDPLEIGKVFIIRNIYYDLNMANIRKDAMVELDKLVTLMRENPTIKIELSSHTDSRGSDYYNMLLSNARAISAVAYIRRRGIAGDRMIAKGYGETRLLNQCSNGVKCSEADHQFNRRTEIKVLAGTFK
jgi:outer membrane protein OmpA-like peptidoglycan-associated protein